jgi:leucyl-tRNA synthetase
MDFKAIESKWQKFWEENLELYRADDNSNKEKKYILVEFPYPSGSGLHVGHAFSFTGGDVYARFKRMQGYNVMFPMGWDAFGLPTENYAIKMKRKPQEITRENTDMFRSQMKRLAFSFDWEREIDTSDPNYYKWTQWIFIQLFKKGLAYKKEMPINWCPSCKIGLANEEVVDGKCERCGTEVERRTISQWVVKITEYADKLIKELEKTEFIDKVKQAQINWIGKSEGAKIKFKIVGNGLMKLEVFTTRPDTLSGVTFMVVAPEHELVLELAKNNEEIKNYLKTSRNKSDLERTELNKNKTGVFSGLYAINPINNKEIPIWISDFVLASYGTGAIMAVPAHDERDHVFAKKFGLPIVPVINKDGWDFQEKPYTKVEKGEEFKKMLDWVEEKGIGERSSSYHLRDWIFSRQHYWGEPIPMIYCEKDGWVPVPEEQLPIVLPEIENYEPTDDGKSPLSKIESFVKCKCPKCGGEAERETDTMPNWAGSDWYYLAYCFADKINKNEANDVVTDIFSDSQKELKKWGPVDVYIGGDEHNTLHLLYSRFVYQFLWDLGVIPKEIPEPYFKRISHGVILGPDNQRMSKSHGNVIVPEIVADKFGVDVIRLYLMFMGPFTGTMAWNENTLMGVKRFIDKLYIFVDKQINLNTDSSDKSKLIINKTILGISRDLENFGFNTAVAKMMEALNTIDRASNEDLMKLIALIAPLAPYTAEELWHKLGGIGSVHSSSWPDYDEKQIKGEVVSLPVAINGKVRDQLLITNYEIRVKEEIIKEAKELGKIKRLIEGKDIIKEIYVPGKMLNLVIRQ